MQWASDSPGKETPWTEGLISREGSKRKGSHSFWCAQDSHRLCQFSLWNHLWPLCFQKCLREMINYMVIEGHWMQSRYMLTSNTAMPEPCLETMSGKWLRKSWLITKEKAVKFMIMCNIKNPAPTVLPLPPIWVPCLQSCPFKRVQSTILYIPHTTWGGAVAIEQSGKVPIPELHTT